ncbi:hypothetical protein EMCRGX_G001944 [Ephydatia muelleri]
MSKQLSKIAFPIGGVKEACRRYGAQRCLISSGKFIFTKKCPSHHPLLPHQTQASSSSEDGISQNKVDLVSTFKPSVATPKPVSPAVPHRPIPAPKPKKKASEMRGDFPKPVATEAPDPGSAEKSDTTAILTLGPSRVTPDPVPAPNSSLEHGEVGVATLPPRDEPSHFTFVGGSPLVSPSTPASTPVVTTLHDGGPSPLAQGQVATPPGLPGPFVFQVREQGAQAATAVTEESDHTHKEVIQIVSVGVAGGQAHQATMLHTQMATSPKFGRRANIVAAPPDPRVSSPTMSRRPIHQDSAPSVEAHGSPRTRADLLRAHKDDIITTETSGRVQTATSTTLGCHAHNEATPPIPIAVSPKSGRPAWATSESYTPPKATPIALATTPPNYSPATPLPATPIPLAAVSSRASMVMGKQNQEGVDQVPHTPTRPFPLTISAATSPSHPPLPPPPSYSPPPPPLSPISPLSESIAAAITFSSSLNAAESLQGLKAAPPEGSGHAQDPSKVVCGSAPLLDDDIYSVVREVAPVVATATERMLDSEYSVINVSSDGEEVGQEGCGQVVPPVVGHAFPVAKEPVRPQLPVPPPPLPHVEESSPGYSTVGGLPGVKAGTFNPPRGEQPGYFVLGPETVRASLVLNGHVPREGDDDDTYSHLAEPPRAHAGADQEGGGEGEDVDTYSHLAEPPRAHAVVTKADEGGGGEDGDTYSHLVDASPRGAVAGGTRQGGDVREDEDTYSSVADPPCSARHVVPPPPSSNGSNDLAACFSFSDGGPSSLPSGNGDGGVVPPFPPQHGGGQGGKGT